MKIVISNGYSAVCTVAAAALLAGCASTGVKNPSGTGVTEMKADERGFVTGTGIESQDLVAVSDKMARGILSSPEIAKAQGVPRIVLQPVINDTRFPINKDIFLTRIRTKLNELAGNRVRFLAREHLPALQQERDQKRTGQITAASDPNLQEFKGADFFLTGRLQGIATRNSAGSSDYVLYTFQLIEARTSDIIWEGSAEIKKQGLEDAAYR